MNQLVIIPFGYEELPAQAQQQLVPICIPTIDPHGRPISMEWFEKGVAPVHSYLVRTARWRLRDQWRASELAEATVFNLVRRHGNNAGAHPSRRIVREAAWVAKDLSAGGRRAERNHSQHQFSISGSEHRLIDPTDYAGWYQHELFLDALETRLQKTAQTDMMEAFALLRLGYRWPEIADLVGFPEKTLKQRFYRWIQSIPDSVLHGLPPIRFYPSSTVQPPRQFSGPRLPDRRDSLLRAIRLTRGPRLNR